MIHLNSIFHIYQVVPNSKSNNTSTDQYNDQYAKVAQAQSSSTPTIASTPRSSSSIEHSTNTTATATTQSPILLNNTQFAKLFKQINQSCTQPKNKNTICTLLPNHMIAKSLHQKQTTTSSPSTCKILQSTMQSIKTRGSHNHNNNNNHNHNHKNKTISKRPFYDRGQMQANEMWIGHMDMDEIEILEGMPPEKAMIAGASAGVTEHLFMFPVDTIKTRMQATTNPAYPQYRNVFHAVSQISKEEGVLRLYRGIPVVVMGAIPSHAAYFAVYEFSKHKLGGNQEGYHPIAHGLSGAFATMAHDAVITPLDVVKQRLQLYKSEYKSVTQCIKHIIRQEGIRAFYVSYPTTVLMNIPFTAVHFATYEGVKHFLEKEHGESGPLQHITAGACAGAFGGFVSNPLDVVKTRIQTQGVDGAPRYNGTIDCIRKIWAHEGSHAFLRGTTARVLYFMPSAAICWTTYEAVKSIVHITS